MADFDAEFHLRRHAEDEFGTDDEARTVPDRARTLVLLDLLSLEEASAILLLYRRARALREDDGDYFGGDADEDDGDAAPEPVRVVLLDQAVAAPYGTVHLRHATFGARRVRLAVTIDFGKVGGPQHGGFRHPPDLVVADDQGASTSLEFSGGGGQRTWTGHFESDATLSTTTAWLEVNGQRVALAEQPSLATVSVRDVQAETGPDVRARGERYLEHCLERGTHRHWRGSALSTVLDTMIDSGSLPADAPAVLAARTVQRALTTRELPDLQALPPRWRSILAPAAAKRRGPKGELSIAAVTPTFDGLRLALLVLTSSRSRFEVELDGRGAVSDSVLVGHHGPSQLTFTAVDDLGNHYLGESNSWHSGDVEFGGTVSYRPPLDPKARSLSLSFNTPRASAVAEMPLRWGAKP